MKKCLGRCKAVKPYSEFGENRHGNPMGKCRECVRLYQKEYRLFVLEPRRREEKAVIMTQDERDWLALPVYQRPKRPCSIFAGYLFAGDL